MAKPSASSVWRGDLCDPKTVEFAISALLEATSKFLPNSPERVLMTLLLVIALGFVIAVSLAELSICNAEVTFTSRC
jgi:hypothetical protein